MEGVTPSGRPAAPARDRRLLGRVRKVLGHHEPFRASGSILAVDVSAGVVRLSGRVRTQTLKQIADYLLRTVEGVSAVENELVSDTEVTRAVADALASDPTTRPHVIRVEARFGQAKLLGIVPSPEVERRALEVAGAVSIAEGAVSELEIDPQAGVEAIAAAEPRRQGGE